MPIKLGAQTFHVPPPGGMRSFSLQQRIWPVAARLGAAIAPLVPILLASEKATLKELDLEDALRVIPDALPRLGEVFAAMPPGELEWITRQLLSQATFGKAPLFGSPDGDAFDGIMAGRTLDTWRLLAHAMEVWYPDFFGGARGLLARRAANEKPSETSSTSSPSGPAEG